MLWKGGKTICLEETNLASNQQIIARILEIVQVKQIQTWKQALI